MIDWRDIRSVETLRAFLKMFNSLESAAQEEILGEMLALLEEQRQTDLIFSETEKVMARQVAKPLLKRKRGARRQPAGSGY